MTLAINGDLDFLNEHCKSKIAFPGIRDAIEEFRNQNLRTFPIN